MDLNTLKTFCVVASTLNFSRAAERRNLTQPAVSLQIKQLENIIGCPLFFRHPLRLTDAGHLLLINAKDILDKWQQTIDFVNQEKSLTTGNFTIACSDAVLRFCLIKKISLFKEKYPGINLSLINRTSTGAISAVLSGEADIAFALHQKDHPKLQAQLFFSYSEVAAISKKHHLSDKFQISSQELSKQNLLVLEEKTLSRQLTTAWFTASGDNVSSLMALGSIDAQIEMARLGLGVALIPDYSVPDDLVALEIQNLPKRQIDCFYQHLKPAAQAWLKL